MCYNKSMKRIDVLKGIEQILVQKAYDTGHISHRADGDWQKQADGSWKPYTGQSNQSAPQTQKPIENTEYGEITEEDLKELDEKELSQHLSNMHNQAIQSLLNDLENGKITEDQFKSQMSDLNNNITTSLNNLDGNEEENFNAPEVNLYDADQVDLSGYANNINIDGGVADNDDLEDVASQILIDNNLEITDENMNKARDAMLSWLDANGYLDSDDEDYEDDVEKSAVRDMQSALTTKNMGF